MSSGRESGGHYVLSADRLGINCRPAPVVHSNPASITVHWSRIEAGCLGGNRTC